MTTTTIQGLGDLKANLQSLPDKLMKRVLTSALRQGANVIKDEAKALCPVETGALRASIRVTARRGTATLVHFNVVAGGLSSAQQKKFGIETAFYAVMVEEGHLIRGKGQALKGGTRSKSLQRAILVEHGAASVPAHPFMRPALENKAQDAITEIADEVSSRMQELVD